MYVVDLGFVNGTASNDSDDIFFFNDTATTEIYTLSLHDALPILPEHRNYLRFLWYNENNIIKDFRMKVHIFGATLSPACAKYGPNYIATRFGSEFPDAENFIHGCLMV